MESVGVTNLGSDYVSAESLDNRSSLSHSKLYSNHLCKLSGVEKERATCSR